MERRTFLQAAAAIPFVPNLSVPEPEVKFVSARRSSIVRPWGSQRVNEALTCARKKGDPFEIVVSAHDVADIRMWCRRDAFHDPPPGPVLDVFDIPTAKETGYFGRFDGGGPYVRIERDSPVGLFRILDQQGTVLAHRFSEMYETDRNVLYTVKISDRLMTVAAGKASSRGLTAIRFLDDPGPHKDRILKAVYDRYQSERRPLERFERKMILRTQAPVLERPEGTTAFVAEGPHSITAIEKAERVIVPVFGWDQVRLETAAGAILHAMGNPQDGGYVGYVIETTHMYPLQGLVAFRRLTGEALEDPFGHGLDD